MAEQGAGDAVFPFPTGIVATAAPNGFLAVRTDDVVWMRYADGSGATFPKSAGVTCRGAAGADTVVASGKITGGSDLNGDGRGDLLATDKAGVLWFYASTGNATAPFAARKKIGGGWGVHNLLITPGTIAGASGGDLVARDTSGTLWL